MKDISGGMGKAEPRFSLGGRFKKQEDGGRPRDLSVDLSGAFVLNSVWLGINYSRRVKEKE